MARYTQDELQKKVQEARERGVSESIIQSRVRQLQDNGEIYTNQQPQQPEKQGSFVGEVAGAIARPAIDFAKFVGEAGAQAGRYITNPTFRKVVKDPNSLTPEEQQEVNQMQDTFFVDPETIKNRETIAKTGAKRTAGAMSYAVPAGTGLKGAVALGGVAGALDEASRDDATLESVAGGAVAGGATGGVFKGGSTLFNKAKSFIDKGKQSLGKRAAANVIKGTAGQFDDALAAGVNPVELSQKYIPAGSGYDDLIGDITKKGKGGVFKDELDKAETVIKNTVEASGGDVRFSGDDIVGALESELKDMSSQLGKESQKKALKKIVEETKKMWKTGKSSNQLLEILRKGNKRFGKKILETEKDAVATMANKLQANTARKILKTSFPMLAESLDKQSDILILRPMIQKARRNALKKGLKVSFDLGKPLNFLNMALENPEVASTLQKVGIGATGEAVSKTSRLGGESSIASKLPFIGDNVNVPSKKEVVGRQVAGDVGGAIAGRDQGESIDPTLPQVDAQSMESDTKGSGLITIRNTETGETKQVPAEQLNEFGIDAPEISGKPSKELLERAYFEQLSRGNKEGRANAAEIMDAIKQFYPAAGSGGKSLSEGDKKFALAGQEAKKALDFISSGKVKTGKLEKVKSGIETFIGTEEDEVTATRSQIATARTAARNALLGANMSDAELESYLDAVFDFGLEPKILKQRLETFVQSMDDYQQFIAGVPQGVTQNSSFSEEFFASP